MYCPVCGEKIPDGSLFCRYCGAEVNEGNSGFANAAPESIPSVMTEDRRNDQPDNLVLSIIGLALAALGGNTGASIAGLVLSIIGRGKALKNAGGSKPTGKNKVAYILSTVGIPVSIVMTLVAIVYWIIEIVQAGNIAELFKEGIHAAFSLFLG